MKNRDLGNARAQMLRPDDGAPEMRVWMLRARDLNEPPFHFSHVAVEFVIAAEAEEPARRLAALHAGPYGDVWADDEMTSCEELSPLVTGILAVKTSV